MFLESLEMQKSWNEDDYQLQTEETVVKEDLISLAKSIFKITIPNFFILGMGEIEN